MEHLRVTVALALVLLAACSAAPDKLPARTNTGRSETPGDAPDVSAVRQAFPVLWLGPNQLECRGLYRDICFRLTPEKSHQAAVLLRSILTDPVAEPGHQPDLKEASEIQIVFQGREEFAEHKAVFGLYERYNALELQSGKTIAVPDKAMARVLSLIKESSLIGPPASPKEGPPPPNNK